MTLGGEEVTASNNIREGLSTLFGSNAAYWFSDLFPTGIFRGFLYICLSGREAVMVCSRDGRREGAQRPVLRVNEPKKTNECSPRAGNATKTCYLRTCGRVKKSH